MQSFLPRLDILPEAQKRIWEELSSTPDNFILYGGTAIALRLGHRNSVDFDFFSFEPINPYALLNSVPYLAGGTPIQMQANTLAVSVDRDGPVKLAYFGGLKMGQIAVPDIVDGPAFAVASLIDLGGTKVAVITQRIEVKDYLDIHALITQAKLPLAEMLGAAKSIYGSQFNPLISLKAITYHEDLDPVEFPTSMRMDLVRAAKSVDLSKLPLIGQRGKQTLS